MEPAGEPRGFQRRPCSFREAFPFGEISPPLSRLQLRSEVSLLSSARALPGSGGAPQPLIGKFDTTATRARLQVPRPVPSWHRLLPVPSGSSVVIFIQCAWNGKAPPVSEWRSRTEPGSLASPVLLCDLSTAIGFRSTFSLEIRSWAVACAGRLHSSAGHFLAACSSLAPSNMQSSCRSPAFIVSTVCGRFPCRTCRNSGVLSRDST